MNCDPVCSAAEKTKLAIEFAFVEGAAINLCDVRGCCRLQISRRISHRVNCPDSWITSIRLKSCNRAGEGVETNL